MKSAGAHHTDSGPEPFRKGDGKRTSSRRLTLWRARSICVNVTWWRLHIAKKAKRAAVRVSHEAQFSLMQGHIQSPALLKCTAHRLPARIGFADCSGRAVEQCSPQDPGFANKPRVRNQVKTRQLINKRWRHEQQRWARRRTSTRTPLGDCIQQIAVYPVNP